VIDITRDLEAIIDIILRLEFRSEIVEGMIIL